MSWWIWLLLGLVLVLAEVLTPGGFALILFGAAALLTGFIAATGVLTLWWAQWILFALLSVAMLLALRQPLVRALRPPAVAGEIDTLVGETAHAAKDIGVNEVGTAELRGSSWTVRNVGPAPLARGQRCKVQKVDGLMLFVKAE
jgi:membrane protein implicated in regulation of membrane protease activity